MLDEKNFTEESALKDLLSQMVQSHVRKNGQPVRRSGDMEVHDELGILENENENKKSVQSIIDIKEEIELDDGEVFEEEVIIEVEKELDDDGGIEIRIQD
ncbi:hypothetical protein HC823_01745 [Candidatus Gracilibacteria bacterium]|nr:hypothetical protein [Candidatus Gracilibacteria bacterium]